MCLKRIFPSLFLLFCFCLLKVSAQQDKSIPLAVNGVIDLREQSFNEEIPLNGQWLFYWKDLVNPGESVEKGGQVVSFPYRWTDINAARQKFPAFGYATYQLKVLLPPIETQFSLDMVDTYSAYRLYVNGKLLAANGRVSTSATGFIPYWQQKIIDVPVETDTLNITLHISNFVHSKGGISESIFIGHKEQMHLEKEVSNSIDLLLTGCLFMGGIFFLGLYLVGNRDKAILFFSLFLIVYCYRIIGVDNYVLHNLFPHISWYITIRLEYFTLFFGIALFILYTRYLYPEDIHKTIVNVLSILCFSFALMTLIFPPFYFTQLITPFSIINLFCAFYVPYVYVLAYKRKRPGAIYTMLSSFPIMLTISIILLHYWSYTPPYQLLSFACYISFFFLQSLILSHRVWFTLKKSRREAEQGLVVKSEFLSTMSHEIRTPLNAVIGMSHLLLKNDPRQDQMEQMDVMLFSANNLLNIVNDILDYHKIEAGKVTFEHIEMDIKGIAKSIVASLQTAASDKNIELKLKIDEALKNKVFGDPTRITQVITNLVHNAIKFTNAGYVQVVIAIASENETHISLNIQIKDTGIGISKEKQKLIFERFTQADSSTSRAFGGSGLGLAICKRILALQDSSLAVQSEEGKGAVFYFMQTFEKGSIAHTQNTTQPATKEDKLLANTSILVVEDNAINALIVKKYLEQWGASIDIAKNGVEAITMLDIKRHKLVLMDLHMPLMDGYEASKRMRAAGVTLPIIAFTANLPTEVEELVKNSGMDDLIAKPFLPDELYSKVLHYSLNH